MRSITQPSTYENKERRLLTQCESLLKRLEEGPFSWPASNNARDKKLKLAPQALQLLLDGVDLKGASMRGWYQVE